MVVEFDREHATTAMAGPVQSPTHQSDSAVVGGLGSDDGHPRARGSAVRTPLTVFSTEDGVAIVLTYGRNRDWLKNLTAAGEARMQRYGKTFTVTDPRVMPRAEAAPAVKGWWRPIFSVLPFEDALLLKRG
jgi:deazaflavin-dependent oxidoreductase (nitroreductase family)